MKRSGPMSDAQDRIEALFEAAVALASEALRREYLNRACPDPELRREVESLLAHHQNPDSIFEAKTIHTGAAFSERIGTLIGRYILLELIGEGGCGVVYMAEQKEPVRRRVALKIIKLGMDTKQVVARFEAERQALAMMDHPNIARVLDGGCTETGRPYFVMELVKGQTVTKYCDEQRLSTRQRLELFIPICQAIQHAHQKGIIHRDIKPSNILVATIDGRPVPKVIDFGIAKATQHDLTDKLVFTQFHQLMGTPAYMSPEQAALDSTDIDTRSDVYSLGVLLYELLTGKTPVEAKELTRGGYDEIRRHIRGIEPPRPSQRLTTLTSDELTLVARSRAIEPARLSKLIRGELDWVVLKAMDKDRSRRYETASALALDIRRHLDNEPVMAVKPSPIYHLRKFAGRHKVALATAACFVLLLAVSAGISAAQAIKNKSLFTAAEEARLKEMNAKQRETELRRIAATERDRSQRLLYTANMNLAKKEWDELNVGRVVELLDLHRPQRGQPDLRNFEWFYLERLCHRDLLTFKLTNSVGSVAFSPDGSRLASASGDRTVGVWDATSGQEILALQGLTNGSSSVVYSPDGKRLAAGSGNQIVMWDALTGQELRRLEGHTNGINQVAFSPDGRRLASVAGWFAGEPGEVKLWDTTTGQEVCALKGHTEGANAVAFSPDGKRVASGSFQTVKLWDATTGQELLTFKGHTAAVNSVVFSPDGKRLASASSDLTVRVWDAVGGEVMLTLKGHTFQVNSVVFSPDGKRLASGSSDLTVRVWDAVSGEEILRLKGHSDQVFGVAFSPDGKRLASASMDRTVKVWDATNDEETLTLQGPSGAYFRNVAFSPDGQRLASASAVGLVKVWDITDGQAVLTFGANTSRLAQVVFSPDGKRLATAGVDGTVKVWDAASGREAMTLKGQTSAGGVAFSPNGKWLASAGWEPAVKVWDAASGRETLTLQQRDRGMAFCVAYSPDGKRLATSFNGRIVVVWDATTGQEMLTLGGFSNAVFGVAFSPDGKWLASASYGDRMVRVWDATSGQETLALKGNSRWAWSVAFSPDGKRLAAASRDRTIKLWDTTTGQETLTLKGPAQGEGISSVAFSPDGQRLAASWDSTVRVWDARPRPQESTPEATAR